MVLLPETSGQLVPRSDVPGGFEVDAAELEVGQWVYAHRQMAGLGSALIFYDRTKRADYPVARRVVGGSQGRRGRANERGGKNSLGQG